MTFKGNFASRRDNILVGVRGGRKRVEKQEWDLWTEMSGDRWKPGRYPSPLVAVRQAWPGWGGARVTDTSQRSGPVFAGRDVRFRQI